MTYRFNFTKRPRIPCLSKGLADPQKRTRAIVPEASLGVNTQKRQSSLRTRRPRRDAAGARRVVLGVHEIAERRHTPPGATRRTPRTRHPSLWGAIALTWPKGGRVWITRTYPGQRRWPPGAYAEVRS
jgi:hypothetical protein